MFLFMVGENITVGKVTYEIKSKFELNDQNWYTVIDLYDNSLDNKEESTLFKSKAEYEKNILLNTIKELKKENTSLKNDLVYYKAKARNSYSDSYYFR